MECIGGTERTTNNVLVEPLSNCHSSSHELIKYALLDTPNFDCFSTLENQLYFKHHHMEEGPSLLVARSQGFVTDLVQKIDKTEVCFHVGMASLLCTLTRQQRDDLASLLKMCIQITQQHEKPSQTLKTILPCTAQLMRSLYVKGKNAILPSLPRPSIRMIGDHAYVSLRDCVADLLGQGLKVQHISTFESRDGTVSNASESHFSQLIYDRGCEHHGSEPFLCLYITEWSDGFEPSISTKANRGSCWIKTVTISPMSKDIHNLSNTYPIAISRDNVSHECIEKEFSMELKKFQSGESVTFYYGLLKRNVTVSLELLVSLQDQPERRSANSIMLGGSMYTARWGVLTKLWCCGKQNSIMSILLSRVVDWCVKQ
jgi:hypothetical protein